MTLSDDSMVKASGEQVSSEIDGETVSLNLKSGIYYSLNAVGSRIWQILQESSSVRDIRETIVEEFEVDAERCERDVLRLLSELSAKGLIEVDGAKTP